MELVVNELETKYGDRVAFASIDARSQLGEDAYNFYALRGHPIVAILDEEGKLIAQVWGERPIDEIEGPLQEALRNKTRSTGSQGVGN
jgi:hypothetical protein